jgi:NhaA family Na+:H+ antiporter
VNVPGRSRGILKKRAEGSFVDRRLLLPAQALIEAQEVSAAVLFLATVAALVWANSPWSASYFQLWRTPLSFDLGFASVSRDLGHWVTEGLMTLFFFLVGLEIKREFLRGQGIGLRGFDAMRSLAKAAALPMAGAAGGMALPALLYLALNSGKAGAGGWAIPMATDIAFALGVLALLGDRVPAGLRVLLLTLAVVDDIGAILAIALFYSHELSPTAIGRALLILGVIVAMRQSGMRNVALYLLVGVCFWTAVLHSGVHATIAGVILGLLTPATARADRDSFHPAAASLLQRYRQAHERGDADWADALLGQLEELIQETEAPLERIERQIRPWVGYLVLPLFALASAGVPLSGDLLREAFSSRVTLGVFLGLLCGKLIGTIGGAWLAVRFGLAEMTAGVKWPHLIGISLLAGIGFTVSLFITDLAFVEMELASRAKIGILAASGVAGVAGYLFLRRIPAEE